jgi:hypothetical protein
LNFISILQKRQSLVSYTYINNNSKTLNLHCRTAEYFQVGCTILMYFSSYKTHVKVHNFANNEIYYQLLRKTRRQNCIVCGLYYVRTNILCCSSRTMHHLLDNRLTRNVSEAGWKTELLLKLRNAFVSRLL